MGSSLDDIFQDMKNDDLGWVAIDKYRQYPTYVDSGYVYVEDRTIGSLSAQVSVQGESRSQYIAFIMDRFYDGIDISEKSIWIHYELADGKGSEDAPINAFYNDNQIKFGWIIPVQSTQKDGKITFSIWANGIAPNSEDYLLKTLPKEYEIKKGQTPGSGIEKPDDTWYMQFVNQMDAKVEASKQYSANALKSADAAGISEDNAAKSASDASKTLDSAKTVIAQATESAKAAIVAQGAETLESIPEEYVALDADVKTLKKDAVRYSAQFSNALIGTVAGEGAVTMGDSAEAVIPDICILGKTTQVKTTGANLFDVSKIKTTTMGGATVTNNNDGSLTISGAGNLTDGFNTVQIYSREEAVKILKPGKYTITKNANVYPFIYFRVDLSDGVKKETSTLYNTTIILTEDDLVKVTQFLIGFSSTAGQPIKAGKIKPMVWAKETPPTDVDWEPYTGGKPSPSLEYPQELVIAGIKNTGSQLFDSSKIASFTGSGVTITNNNDGGFTINGTSTGYPASMYFASLPVGTYTVSAKYSGVLPATGLFKVRLYSSVSESKDYGIGRTFTVDGSEHSINLRIQIDSGITVNNFVIYPMLNAGNVAKPWEPYTGGKTDGDIQVQVGGSNLFDASKLPSLTAGGVAVTNNGDGSFTVAGAGNLTASFYKSYTYTHEDTVKLLKPGKYTINGSPIYPYVVVKIIGLEGGAQKELNSIGGRGVLNLTQDMLDLSTSQLSLFIYGSTGNPIVPGVIRPMLWAKETAPTDANWEPYRTPQLVTLPTPTGLPGIGDIQDRIICKDGVWGIERRIKKVVFDGSADEIWTQSGTNITNSWRYRMEVPNAKVSYLTTAITTMCSNLPLLNSGETFDAKKTGYTIGSDFYLYVYLDGRTLAEFRTWLASNPITLVYTLVTPVFEPFAPALQTQLNALHTYAPTTAITNDAGAQMQVQYVKDINVAFKMLEDRVALLEGR